MHLDDALLQEARRVLTTCTVCGYCSGFCEMFRAAGRRSIFTEGEIAYLAHLCHDCGNCLDACQYAPPHVFQIDPPKVLADLRSQFWPKAKGWIALACVPLTPLFTWLLVPTDILFGRHGGAGAFYAVLPWSVLCLGAGLALFGSIAMLCLGLLRFWRNSGGGNPIEAIGPALLDVLTLRNLKGGGISCHRGGTRRWAHQSLLAGFGLCLASTSIATIYHHGFGYLAPYPYLSLPVVLGSAGGTLMITGCSGLCWVRLDRNNRRGDGDPGGIALLSLLMSVVISGFALLIWRETVMMGLLLALHFGIVLSLFFLVSMGKLAHGAYRAAALLRAAMERRMH